MEEEGSSHFTTTIVIIILVTLWIAGGFNVARGISLFFGTTPEADSASSYTAGKTIDPYILELYNKTHLE